MSDVLARALALYQGGDYQKSEELYREHIKSHPDDSGAWHMLGYIAIQQRDFGKAIESIERAIELKPGSYIMHVNLGSALMMSGDFERAGEILRSAIDTNPNGPEAHFALGNCLRSQQQFQSAQASDVEAIRLRPDWADALETAGLNAIKLGDQDEALEFAQRALSLEPSRILSHTVAGNALVKLRRYDEALHHYREASRIDPNDAVASSNIGLVLSRMARYEESQVAYRQAIKLNPADPGARHGLSLALLMLGKLSEGWEHYHTRMDREGYLLSSRPIQAPRLYSRPQGQNILAWTDEGVGEQIMFANLIPEVAKDCSELHVECDARLAPLFRRSFKNVTIIPRHDPPHPLFNQPYDGQFCLSNASQWYRPDFSSFPTHEGYLAHDAELTRQLRKRYLSSTVRKPLVGISWRTKDQVKLSAEKSLALKNWRPLLSLPGVTFVNLQYGDTRAEISEVAEEFGVQILSDPRIDPLSDLDTFASQVAAMDLVITTSNATAHMAGALNVPVWTFVPKGFGAMWHWFLERNDSPWYPSMRLIRQVDQNDWEPVVETASGMLADFVTGWRPSDNT